MTLWIIRVRARPPFYPAPVVSLRGSARNRAIGSVALTVLACVLAFMSVFAVWMRALVLDTHAYVRAVGPLIEKPALRDAIATEVVDELYQHVDVPQLLRESLPKRADALAPTLAQGIHDTSIKLASDALGTAAVRRVWEEANRLAHDQIVHVLEGKGQVVTTAKGEVALELRPLAEQVRRALDGNGVRLFDSVPASALDRRFVLFRSEDLARAQRATRVLDALGIWLPLVTVVTFAGAVALAEHRRRAVGRIALALAGTMVVVTIGIAIGRSLYLDRVGTAIPRAAAAVPFDGLVVSLRRWVRILFALSALAWFATWLAGSREAVAREREARIAASRIAKAHGRILAGSGAVLAAFVIVAWDRPQPGTVGAVVGALALWEVALLWLARGSGETTAAAP